MEGVPILFQVIPFPPAWFRIIIYCLQMSFPPAPHPDEELEVISTKLKFLEMHLDFLRWGKTP